MIKDESSKGKFPKLSNKQIQKKSVREELEYWNVVYILRKLNIYYRNKLRGKNKELQGLEANDFSMQVLTKIVSEERSWANSNRIDFITWVYDVALGEWEHFIRANKNRSFIDFSTLKDKIPKWDLKDDYEGF